MPDVRLENECVVAEALLENPHTFEVAIVTFDLPGAREHIGRDVRMSLPAPPGKTLVRVVMDVMDVPESGRWT